LPHGLLGFPHQPGLQALRSSAAECELCRLILSQVDLVIAEFQVALGVKSFLVYYDSSYPTFDLFLRKRPAGGDGFWVICNSTVRDVIYLLAAVGLSVRDGIYSLRKMLRPAYWD